MAEPAWAAQPDCFYQGSNLAPRHSAAPPEASGRSGAVSWKKRLGSHQKQQEPDSLMA